MRNYLFILYLCLFACESKEVIVSTTELKNWEFEFKNNWHQATVPGNNFSDLLNHNIIQNPFYANNEDSVQWIHKEEWVYRSRFTLSENQLLKENHNLTFYGLDTYAEIFLNDKLILETDNMFRKWDIDVKRILKSENLLVIKFKSLKEIEKRKINKLGYNLPGGNRVHTRKAAFHYGWDWGPKILTSGIWRKVELIQWNDCKLKDIYIKQDFLSDSICNLSLELEIKSSERKDVKIKINENSHNYKLKKGNQKIKIKYSIENPERWWPSGYGNQKLYNIKVEITDGQNIIESINRKIGLRDIQLITDKDSIGESFYFKINTLPIFIKGANYIPQDNLQSRVSTSHYKSLLQDVKDANMNMIRVWGGGIYEEEEFYNLCDSLGILVWQDFMFACGMYPSDSLFLENIKEESVYNVKRLSHHPSIALWCGNNENSEGWKRWGWQDNLSQNTRYEIWEGYQKIFQNILPKTVQEYSQTNYWETSPKLGRGNPKHQFEGDSHYWGIWHDEEPFSNLEKKIPRFMSEYGFQSIPSIESISSFCDSSNWNINSISLLNHQKHPRGNEIILKYMKREYNIPRDFKKYIYCSQILQAEGIRIGIEAHRRNRPICMGTLYWQLNDCWPGISWSSRDYFSRWKALHYTVQDAYSPLLISIHKNKNQTIEIHGISDLQKKIQDILEVKIYDVNGNLIFSDYKEIEINPNSSTILLSKKYNLGANQFIIATLKNKKIKSKILFENKPKDIKFPNPIIEYSWKKNTITLKSSNGAFQVYLHNIDAHFSDNFFNLLPGEEKEISVYAENLDKNNLVIWSLYNLNK